MWHRQLDDNLLRFDTISDCDRQTNEQIPTTAETALCNVSRNKGSSIKDVRIHLAKCDHPHPLSASGCTPSLLFAYVRKHGCEVISS